jgi:hypothetical protein
LFAFDSSHIKLLSIFIICGDSFFDNSINSVINSTAVLFDVLFSSLINSSSYQILNQIFFNLIILSENSLVLGFSSFSSISNTIQAFFKSTQYLLL